MDGSTNDLEERTNNPMSEQTTTSAKLKLPLKQLQHALGVITPAVERKTTIPVLSTVRIEQTPDALEFAATNLDLAIRVRVARPGAATVSPFLLPALKLEAYARLLDGEDVSLACGDTRATLRCGRSTTKLPMLSVANFPSLAFGDGAEGISIPQSVVARLLKHVTFAISDAESRYVMHGALLVVEKGVLKLVSTDGHRLALYTVPFEYEGEPVKVVLPAVLLTALGKVIGGGDAPVMFQVAEDAIHATVQDGTGSIALSCRRLNGQFPNFEAVVPTKVATALVVDAKLAVGTLKRCLTFADDRSGAVKLTIHPTGVALRAASADSGETDETIDVAPSPAIAEPFAIGFNGDYLLDAFTRLAGDAVIRFTELDAQHSIKIVAEPAKGELFEYVVMPMRV